MLRAFLPLPPQNTWRAARTPCPPPSSPSSSAPPPSPLQIELEYAIAGAVEWVYLCIVKRGTPPRSLFSSSTSQGTVLAELRGACAGALEEGADRRAQVRALQRLRLRPMVDRYNAAGGGDKLKATQEKVREAQAALLVTLNKATERDGLLEELQVKTKRLEQTAAAFSSSADSLSCAACCKLYSIYITLALVACVIIAISLLVARYQYHVKLWP